MIRAEMYDKIYYAIALITSKMVKTSTNESLYITCITSIRCSVSSVICDHLKVTTLNQYRATAA